MTGRAANAFMARFMINLPSPSELIKRMSRDLFDGVSICMLCLQALRSQLAQRSDEVAALSARERDLSAMHAAALRDLQQDARAARSVDDNLKKVRARLSVLVGSCL